MRSLLAPVLLALLLAGCTAAPVPDDAFMDTHDGLEGATMWAWLDTESADHTVIHGHFEYAGTELLHTSQEDPRGAWNLTITDADGRNIIYDERPSRKAYYQPESYRHEESFQFTWLHDEYERFEQAAADEHLESHPVPPGNYTVTLQFGVAWEPEDAFQVVLDFVVA